jgi:ElaB/YqjD/DUF883 family membrane-anchored ribosome-binding protein
MATPTSATATGEEVNALKAELGKLQADIAQLTATLKATGATALEAAKKQGASSLEKVKSEAEALAHATTEAGRTQISELEGRIRSQPLMSVGIAFGIGFLVAVLSGRR